MALTSPTAGSGRVKSSALAAKLPNVGADPAAASGPDAPQAVDLRALMHKAAGFLGVPDAVARHFAATGMVQSGPVLVAVRTLLPDSGPLVVIASFDRPAEMPEAQLLAVLLLLNTSLPSVLPAAFGLDPTGRAALVMRPDASFMSPEAFATAVKEMVVMCTNVITDPPGPAAPRTKESGQ